MNVVCSNRIEWFITSCFTKMEPVIYDHYKKTGVNIVKMPLYTLVYVAICSFEWLVIRIVIHWLRPALSDSTLVTNTIAIIELVRIS